MLLGALVTATSGRRARRQLLGRLVTDKLETFCAAAPGDQHADQAWADEPVRCRVSNTSSTLRISRQTTRGVAGDRRGQLNRAENSHQPGAGTRS
ncbi:MAG TPA: hypothetical protein VF328_13825, partial [Mycobacterium sp.]